MQKAQETLREISQNEDKKRHEKEKSNDTNERQESASSERIDQNPQMPPANTATRFMEAFQKLFENMKERDGGNAFETAIKMITLVLSMAFKSFMGIDEKTQRGEGNDTKPNAESQRITTHTVPPTITEMTESLVSTPHVITREASETIYVPLLADTESVLDKKIAYAKASLMSARREKDMQGSSEQLDYVFKAGGLFGKTLYQAKDDEITMIELHIRTLEEAKQKVATLSGTSAEKLSTLQAVRTSLGLPKLTKQLASSDKEFQAIVKEGIDMKTIDLKFKQINEELADADKFMAGLEFTVEGADLAVGFLASGVPQGDKVYCFTRNATGVLTGEFTPQEAATNFATEIIMGKVGAKTFKLMGGKKIVSAWARKWMPRFTKTDSLKMKVELARRYGEGAVTEGLKIVKDGATSVLSDASSA